MNCKRLLAAALALLLLSSLPGCTDRIADSIIDTIKDAAPQPEPAPEPTPDVPPGSGFGSEPAADPDVPAEPDPVTIPDTPSGTDTDPEPAPTADPDIPAEPDPAPSLIHDLDGCITVNDNPGGLTISMVHTEDVTDPNDVWKLDDTHVLFVSGKKKSDGNAPRYQNCTLNLLDLLTGEIAAQCPMPDCTGYLYSNSLPWAFQLACTPDGSENSGYIDVRYDGIRLTADETGLPNAIDEAGTYGTVFTPSGAAWAYIKAREDGRGGDLCLRTGGSEITVKKAVHEGDVLPDGSTATYLDEYSYYPRCFLDENRLVYDTFGPTSNPEWGIYDVGTGECRDFEGLCFEAYIPEWDSYLASLPFVNPITYYLIGSDSQAVETEYAQMNEVLASFGDVMYPDFTYNNGYLIYINPDPASSDPETAAVRFYSLDGELQADVTVPDAVVSRGLMWVVGESFTMLSPKEDPDAPATPAEEPLSSEVTVQSNSGGFRFHSIGLPIDTDYLPESFPFDDTHALYLTGIPGRDPEFYNRFYKDCSLALIDLTTGKKMAECALPDCTGYLESTLIGDGLRLICTQYDDAGASAYRFFDVSYDGTTLRADEVYTDPYPRIETKITSPDGKTAVYATLDDTWGHSRMILRTADGTETVLKTAVMLDDVLENGQSADINDVIGYYPLCFLDNDRFVYTMGGWEWSWGWAVWNLADGTVTEFTDQDPLTGYDPESGRFLTSSGCYYPVPDPVFRFVDFDGNRTEIEPLCALAGNIDWDNSTFYYSDGCWVIEEFEPYTEGKDQYSTEVTVRLYNTDCSELLAEIHLPRAVLDAGMWQCGSDMTFVIPPVG